MPTRDINESWAMAVRRRMRDRGVAGPSELARASGVDQSVISRWLNEGRTPTVDALRRVASPLGATLRDLLIEAGYATQEDLPLAGSLARGTATDGAQDVDVAAAIEHDSALLPEAKAHLLNQYELLLRLQEAAPPSLVRRQQERRHLATVTRPEEGEQDVVPASDEPQPLAYVARTRDGKPVVSDPETEARLAREIDEAVKANPHARKRRK